MDYLPGWTVQCLNPGCDFRGRWLRAHDLQPARCAGCGSLLHNVPPPLPTRFHLRPRPLGAYRPGGRPR
jgi:hypothetical protein